MRVLLAGAGGFIGGHIALAVRSAGHEVVPYNREMSPDDLPDDIEIAVNSAGRLGGQGYRPGELREANFKLPEKLALHCRALNIPLIHLSTPGVCGLRENGTENDPYAPEDYYESTKVEAEEYLLHNLPNTTILRPDFVFGPGDLHKLSLFRQVAKGWFPLVGSGRYVTRPTDARDVARAVLQSFPGGVLHSGIYNIAGPELITVRGLALAIAHAMDRRTLLVPVPRVLFRILLNMGPIRPSTLTRSRYRLFGTHRYTSTDKAERAGFSPRYNFDTTAKTAVKWYAERGLL